MYGNTLYVRCGNGTTAGGQLELSHAVGASETITDVTVSLSSSGTNSGNCTLFVNLEKVDTGTYPSTTDVFGSNAGGIGKRHGTIATTRMGGNTSDYVLTNGTVTSLDVWGGSYLNNS
jgi:hypothetical protein